MPIRRHRRVESGTSLRPSSKSCGIALETCHAPATTLPSSRIKNFAFRHERPGRAVAARAVELSLASALQPVADHWQRSGRFRSADLKEREAISRREPDRCGNPGLHGWPGRTPHLGGIAHSRRSKLKHYHRADPNATGPHTLGNAQHNSNAKAAGAGADAPGGGSRRHGPGTSGPDRRDPFQRQTERLAGATSRDSGVGEGRWLDLANPTRLRGFAQHICKGYKPLKDLRCLCVLANQKPAIAM